VQGVLFVDDDQDLLDAIEEILELSGLAACVTARSLAEVESKREEALRCSLAFVDINLGTGTPTGIDVFRWLESKGFMGNIFFLTGHAADEPLVVQASSLGKRRVLSKPITLGELERLIHENASRPAAP
jgi:DNA-binding NtrC family response regulator